jgi:hypothetical protein
VKKGKQNLFWDQGKYFEGNGTQARPKVGGATRRTAYLLGYFLRLHSNYFWHQFHSNYFFKITDLLRKKTRIPSIITLIQHSA